MNVNWPKSPYYPQFWSVRGECNYSLAKSCRLLRCHLLLNSDNTPQTDSDREKSRFSKWLPPSIRSPLWLPGFSSVHLSLILILPVIVFFLQSCITIVMAVVLTHITCCVMMPFGSTWISCCYSGDCWHFFFFFFSFGFVFVLAGMSFFNFVMLKFVLTLLWKSIVPTGSWRIQLFGFSWTF